MAPSLLATALVLQTYDGVSDDEATRRAAYDLQWKVALGVESDAKPFAKSTLQEIRAQLVVHEDQRLLFQESLELAKRRGKVGRQRRLKVALDTTPILGRGAVKDTYTLPADGIVQVLRVLPAYTRGTERKYNTTYTRANARVQKLRQKGQREEATVLRKQIQTLATRDPADPDYRRLRYVRYADDFLLGFAGPRSEAEEIEAHLGEFLRDHLKLELSKTKTKTLVTHARSEAARFLGYEIGTIHDDTRRSINGAFGVRVPVAVVRAKCEPYLRNGKPVHRPEMEHDSPYSIVRITSRNTRASWSTTSSPTTVTRSTVSSG